MRLDGASVALSLALALTLAATLVVDPRPRAEAPAVVEDAAPADPESRSGPPEASASEPITLPPPPLREAVTALAVPARTLVPRQAEAEPAIAPLTPRPRAVLPAPAQVIEPLRPEPVPETTPEVAAPMRPTPPAPTPVAPVPEVPAPATVALPGDVEDALPESDAEVAAAAVASTAATSEAAVAEGRALLRILEHGSGPAIEIAWPAAPGDRAELFQRFRGCFGMRLALIDGQGRLYTGEGAPGQPPAIDLDRLSGFVRQPAGAMAAVERRQFEDMRAYHRIGSGLAPVRLFPRRVDAFLLGGLRQLIGESYMAAEVLHARYRLAGASVLVEAITVDDRPVAGRIDLGRAARGGCA